MYCCVVCVVCFVCVVGVVSVVGVVGVSGVVGVFDVVGVVGFDIVVGIVGVVSFVVKVKPCFCCSVEDGLPIVPSKDTTIIMPAILTLPKTAKRSTVFCATIFLNFDQTKPYSEANISLQMPVQ